MSSLVPSNRKYKHLNSFEYRQRSLKENQQQQKYNNLSKIHVIYVANLIAGMDI